MATQGEDEYLTLEASGDLSSDQHKFVDVNSSGQATVVGTAGAEAIGVLQNKPDETGEEATIRITGACKVEAGGSISNGDKIAANASGQAVTATAANVDTTTSNSSQDVAGDQVLGIAYESASSGEKFKMYFDLQGLT